MNGNALTFRRAHELRRRVKTHRLAVQQGAKECCRLVALQPCRDIDQQGEARRMRLGKAVFSKPFDLIEDPLGESLLVTLLQHAADQSVPERSQPTASLPGRHRAAQLVGLTGRKAGGDDCELHDLLLKDRHSQSPLEHASDRLARIADIFLAVSAPEIRMHHIALNRARTDNRNLDDEVVITPGL